MSKSKIHELLDIVQHFGEKVHEDEQIAVVCFASDKLHKQLQMALVGTHDQMSHMIASGMMDDKLSREVILAAVGKYAGMVAEEQSKTKLN